MIPPTSIDGTDITGATIDGTDVQEITVDGDTVFSAGPNIPANTVGYWPGTEGSGTVLGDIVGNNDLTINGPTWVSDPDFEGGVGLDFGPNFDDGFTVNGTTPTPSAFTWFVRVNVDEFTSGGRANRVIIYYDERPQLLLTRGADRVIFTTNSGTIDQTTPTFTGTITVVARIDSTSQDLDVFDDSGTNLLNATRAGGTPSYDTSTVQMGLSFGPRNWEGTMDPSWIMIDQRVSDTTMNNIISSNFV